MRNTMHIPSMTKISGEVGKVRNVRDIMISECVPRRWPYDLRRLGVLGIFGDIRNIRI